ncbi:hypothetical protein RJ639_029709 [Escallonia herrerae]|uniref:Non-haem dioxygenase N-terminal domain-containing protein n=1 Tax=Escallonia herrerae TaxID=1293975 RepID=A0AA88X068_9ASTE|nr:hypothetical protein RJ639_029709 [Escallonia herrerae]
MEVASRPIRVQSIAQSSATPQFPPEYIQPPETRPNNLTARPANNNPIPSIDLSSAVRDAVFLCTKIGAACREGAFHVTNHGVPPKLLEEIRRMGHTFFEACPMDEKLRYSCDTSGAATEGYGSLSRIYDGEDVKDFSQLVLPFEGGRKTPLTRTNPVPGPVRMVGVAKLKDQNKEVVMEKRSFIDLSTDAADMRNRYRASDTQNKIHWPKLESKTIIDVLIPFRLKGSSEMTNEPCCLP